MRVRRKLVWVGARIRPPAPIDAVVVWILDRDADRAPMGNAAQIAAKADEAACNVARRLFQTQAPIHVYRNLAFSPHDPIAMPLGRIQLEDWRC